MLLLQRMKRNFETPVDRQIFLTTAGVPLYRSADMQVSNLVNRLPCVPGQVRCIDDYRKYRIIQAPGPDPNCGCDYYCRRENGQHWWQGSMCHRTCFCNRRCLQSLSMQRHGHHLHDVVCRYSILRPTNNAEFEVRAEVPLYMQEHRDLEAGGD
jgi:hypothetical protein